MNYIYESPDGGQTVYRREFGSTDRELYIESGSPVTHSYGMWAEILRAGTTNPTLQHMIEELIIYYKLSKPNGD